MARPRKPRPPQAAAEVSFVASDKSRWHRVIVDGAIHDGNGGFYPAGEMIQAGDDVIASLLAKGLID